MFLLIPFLAGAGVTGYAWYNSSSPKEEEKTFQAELFAVLQPVFLILLGLLILRWLYIKGTNSKP